MHDEAPMKIAAGEWLSTRYEFEDLILNGKIDVAQPDVGRCGGLTEAKKIAKFSQENNTIIVHHLEELVNSHGMEVVLKY